MGMMLSEAFDRVCTRVWLRCRYSSWPHQTDARYEVALGLLAEGRAAEAEQPFRDRMNATSAALGESDWETVEAKTILASLMMLQGDPAKREVATGLLEHRETTRPDAPQPAAAPTLRRRLSHTMHAPVLDEDERRQAALRSHVKAALATLELRRGDDSPSEATL